MTSQNKQAALAEAKRLGRHSVHVRRDRLGWHHYEIRDSYGNLIESGCTSPNGSYDERRTHVSISIEEFKKVWQ